MLVYDHARTEKVVAKLIAAERTIRIATIALLTLGFGLPCAALGLALASFPQERIGCAALGLVAGASAGLAVARLLLIVFSAVMEWMCQVLIALGARVVASRPASKQ